MTNQTISPCPKCGKVPTLIMYGSKFPFVSGVCQCLSDANLIGNSDRTYPVCWENGVDILLGRACRELGIETVEQLKAKVQPDPRVEVLESIQTLLDGWPKYRDSVLGRKDDPPCSVCGGELDTGWECNVCGHDMQMEVCPDIKLWGQITRLIAAQRGEVEK